ncbi:MAG TPA: tRNA lysidine(34) synthetase TilS [Acidobacteriaceae bacterium]|nr:tRNA lysidine(34) synthetase TilS [Acidobacteriaceae bacterium]
MPVPPILNTALFHAGQRVAAAVSGGADSVAMLRRLLEERARLGIVVSVIHVHHGIRGQEADGDAIFVEELAGAYDLPFFLRRGDVPAARRGETLEEAARNFRYACFEALVADELVECVATAHTLDDQAETVLSKLLRGAWTEGLSGIHPVLAIAGGRIVRPFLEATRAGIEDWLGALGQNWREDTTNRDLAHTRNRIRHQLLPALKEFNPEIARQFARMAAVSADEERYWQGELDRILPSLLLPGRPIRGGGRASSTRPGEEEVSIEMERLRQFAPAVRRRVLRAAARKLDLRLNFDQTESLMELAADGPGSRPRKVGLPTGIVAERTLREIRLSRRDAVVLEPGPEYRFQIPGEIAAPEFGLRMRVERTGSDAGCQAILRSWAAGDRVLLRHSRRPKKVAEILDRLGVSGARRGLWPVVEAGGKILWMRGVEAESEGFAFLPSTLDLPN